ADPGEAEDVMRLLVVDDHTLYRRGVRGLLQQHGVDDVDECAAGNEALDLVRRQHYDVVILDLTLPDRDGLDVLKQIKSMPAPPPVLIVSMHAEEQFAVRALKAGAAGYVTKGASADVLWSAVQKVLSGGTFVSAQMGERLAAGLAWQEQREPHERLTDREFQVFRALAAGMPARHIAAQLGLSVKTVNTHRINVLGKLALHSNAELIRYAIERALV
ncbi:MAG TPA: response regulator transcription factor, partial [Thermoanaerobaculia bacterium]|nr:response regulator transcription factor [Thermoanaerobaculia bacterium]